MDSGVGMEMPKYVCHKVVWALRIKCIQEESMPVFSGPTCRGSHALGTACGNCERCRWEVEHGPKLKRFIVPVDAGYAPVEIDEEYQRRHFSGRSMAEIVEGYYVVYADGYKSWSPAKAFEEGYTRLGTVSELSRN